MGLCGLRALRGLWGFCVRERLGGLKACGVFAFVFPLFAFPFVLFAFFLSSLYSLCPSLFWLSFACPIVLSCLFLWSLLLFPFPFRTTRKKKGRKGFALCVLSSFVVGLFGCSDSCNVIEELRGRCFGSF